jgi:chromosome segregation ATPase
VILQVDLESLKNECVSLKSELESAVQGRNAIKSDYDIYKKRVQSVLAEQDSQYNRTIELERSLQASTAACDAKCRELQRALSRLSEMEAITAQV